MRPLRFAIPIFAVLLIALSATNASAQVQQGKPANPAAPTAPLRETTQASSPANALTQAAVQQGVLTCASRINQVTNFLGFNAQAGAVVMSPPEGQDQRLIPLAMEIPTENGSAYVSAQFAPNQANGCGAAYDAVAYWPQKCDVVAAKQFATLKSLGQLKRTITVLDGGVATKVFLMPAGNGCVSIKNEVVL